jgi:glycosyltransferase involved in cell wall biosynthesis
MQSPMLSITVLNYNYAHYLPRCLDSILRQDFTDYELILINDKSTDNSLEVIQPYLADPRIRLIDHAQNKGFVASLIEGSDQSRGTYITVISADDWILTNNAFSEQIAVMQSDPQTAFVYTAYGHFLSVDQCESIWRSADESFVYDEKTALKHLLLGPFLLHSGTIIRKTAYIKTGGYDSAYRYAVDTQMWLRLCHIGKVAYINKPFYAYHRHGNNMSRSSATLRIAIGEIIRAIDSSFAMLPSVEQVQLTRLHKQSRHRALMAFALDDIFRNQYRSGWKYFWVVLQLYPVETIFQRQALIAVLRTLLGKKMYDKLYQI